MHMGAENPDIPTIMHAIRVELTVRHVMSAVVPSTEMEPFLYWLRFEWGKSGNPHAHGQCWASGNPALDRVFKDEAARHAYELEHPNETTHIPTWEEMETTIASYFRQYNREMHPCKDPAGRNLLPFQVEGLTASKGARPQCVNMLEVLEKGICF